MTESSEQKTILTTGEVAMRLGYSDDHVRRLCENGYFDGDPTQGIAGAYRICVGAHWRIPNEAVDHFLTVRRATVRRR